MPCGCFVYDACGNLTFDGSRKYTYDASNRLVSIENAFKDAGVASGALQTGSRIGVYQYDAMGRRIRKDVYLGGILDDVEHYYYVGHCIIETRNGSDQVTQQQVWDSLAPNHYIDSLAQVATNDNPGVDDDDASLFTCQRTKLLNCVSIWPIFRPAYPWLNIWILRGLHRVVILSRPHPLP